MSEQCEASKVNDSLDYIERVWDDKIYDELELKNNLENVIFALETGVIRSATKVNEKWVANQAIKKAILLYMKTTKNKITQSHCGSTVWFDKFDQRFASWKENDFLLSKIRSVPGSYVRRGAYVASDVVLMPSFVNVGAYVGSRTMVDTWSTIGSCAQIGENCHIAGGVGIGGVLEPLLLNPVIIEDGCFIGARSEIVEGVIVGEGSVIAMGCYISPSTKIVVKKTGEIISGYIPPYSVVIPGSIKMSDSVSTYCVVIVKQVDERTRQKVQINDLLRFTD